MDTPEVKVILTADQVPSFIATVKQAVGQQLIVQSTVAEAMALTTGIGLVFMTLERALGGTTTSPSPNEGLSGNGEQQRPV